MKLRSFLSVKKPRSKQKSSFQNRLLSIRTQVHLVRNLAIRRLALLTVAVFAIASVQPASAQVHQGDPMKEFVLSASYGVLAGTLVGASTLAFSDKPGDNLNKVARGASLGLYGGIILGLFILYGGPSGADDDLVSNEAGSPVEIASRFNLYPLFSETGALEGAKAEVSVLRF